MSSCAYCGVLDADLFDLNGNPMCAACDARARAALVEQRGVLAQEGKPLTTLTDSAAGAPTWLLMLFGILLTASALLFGVVEWFIIGRLHYVVFFIILLAGLGCFFYAMSQPTPMKRKPK